MTKQRVSNTGDLLEHSHSFLRTLGCKNRASAHTSRESSTGTDIHKLMLFVCLTGQAVLQNKALTVPENNSNNGWKKSLCNLVSFLDNLLYSGESLKDAIQKSYSSTSGTIYTCVKRNTYRRHTKY